MHTITHNAMQHSVTVGDSSVRKSQVCLGDRNRVMKVESDRNGHESRKRGVFERVKVVLAIETGS